MANPEIRTRTTPRERRLIDEIGRRIAQPGVTPQPADVLRFCLHHGARAVGIEQPSTWGVEPEETTP